MVLIAHLTSKLQPYQALLDERPLSMSKNLVYTPMKDAVLEMFHPTLADKIREHEKAFDFAREQQTSI